MKRWTCRKCGKETDRRQGLCDKGDEHEWVDTREYLEAVAAKKARRRREAEERRQKATAEYQSFLNSAEGKEQHAKIAGGYMARRKTASIRSLILGLISIIAIPVGCIAFARLLKSGKIVSLPLLVMAISFSFPFYFYESLKKRAKVIPKFRSLDTGRTVSIVDTVKSLASREISRNFEYEDENGHSCVPEPFVPDPDTTSYTEAEWHKKMEYAEKLNRRKKWAEAADEYRKIGNGCGLLTISAPAWWMAALCYDILDDEQRTIACYKNAVLSYKKLANQGHEGAQETLALVEKGLETALMDQKE